MPLKKLRVMVTNILPLISIFNILLVSLFFLILKLNSKNYIATTPPPTTTTGPIPTMEPPKYLYKNTADYHWPLFSDNKTKVDGDWKEEYKDGKSGYGEGPFGFGSSVKLEDNQCMMDEKFLKEGDECGISPANCEKGFSFSIWEKNSFPKSILNPVPESEVVPSHWLSQFHKRKYLVTSGPVPLFNTTTGRAFPGFELYRQGPELYGTVSTGTKVWQLKIMGQLYNATWNNIGLRWYKPDLLDEETPIWKLGGLEMYINGQNVGSTLMAVTVDKEQDDLTEFSTVKFWIDGKEPPIISIGCGYDDKAGQWKYHSGGEYDELAIWTRSLVKNASMNELPFMMGGYSSDFSDVSPDAFNSMMGDVNLESDKQAELAQEVLESMLLGPPTTTPAIPTRTADPSVTTTTEKPMIEQATTSVSTTTTAQARIIDCPKLKDEINSTQIALSSMLTSECSSSRKPEDAEKRFALARVAAKLLSGEQENIEKWKCFEELSPQDEGAPKTLRQMEDYILSFVGCVNISAEEKTVYYNEKRHTMNFATSGDDFVMNVDKMGPETLREGIRLEYPHYDNFEWAENKASWGEPKDTFSVPTGMFKDDEDCNDKPVTISATIMNNYGNVTPPRKNPTFIRAKEWRIDSKVVSVKVSLNPDPVTFNTEEVINCRPNMDYMKDNPVRATLYHKEPGKARIVRRRGLLWHTNMVREGIEVRQCAVWNEEYSMTGAWDPAPCVVKETDSIKTTCECSAFGAMVVIAEVSEKFEVNDKCDANEFIKYAGMAITMILHLVFCILVVVKKHINDMFHDIRSHVCMTWCLGLVMNIATDFHKVREDIHMNLIIGMIMVYFYTSSLTWVCCEAHAIFKALTAGIISARTKVYKPFGYGTPFSIIGVLFLFFADELGTDPRCFLAWDRMTKKIYFYYMFGLAFIASVFALIILFNIARPQTKRKNVVADLISQARGSAITCFAMAFFWIFGFITYVRNPESDTPEMYCIFIIVLGFFGVVIFATYGLMSKRFRNGLRAPKAKYIVQEDTISTISRPSTATSMTSAKTISETPSSPLPETSEDNVILTEDPENPNDPVEDEVENETPPEASDDTPEAEQEPIEEPADDVGEDNPVDAGE